MPTSKRIFWAAYAAIYDLLWDNELTAMTAQAVIAELGERQGPVCEVGAGTGLITRHLEMAGLSVESSEPNASMATRFARRLPDTEFERLTIDEVAESRGSSGDVVAVNVLHLTSDPAKALSNLLRVAGPDGRAIVVTPRPETTVLRVAKAQRICGVSRWRAIRFWLLHLLLAPLTLLSDASPRKGLLRALNPDDAKISRSISGVSLLLVYSGTRQSGPQKS